MSWHVMYLHRHSITGCVEWSYSPWHGLGWVCLGECMS